MWGRRSRTEQGQGDDPSPMIRVCFICEAQAPTLFAFRHRGQVDQSLYFRSFFQSLDYAHPLSFFMRVRWIIVGPKLPLHCSSVDWREKEEKNKGVECLDHVVCPGVSLSLDPCIDEGGRFFLHCGTTQDFFFTVTKGGLAHFLGAMVFVAQEAKGKQKTRHLHDEEAWDWDGVKGRGCVCERQRRKGRANFLLSFLAFTRTG